MRWYLQPLAHSAPWPRRLQQRAFAFWERSERRDRWFKRVVVVLTLLTVGGLLGAILAKNDRVARLAYSEAPARSGRWG